MHIKHHVAACIMALIVLGCSIGSPHPASAVSWGTLQVAPICATELLMEDDTNITISNIPEGEVVSITSFNAGSSLYYSVFFNGQNGLVLKSAFPSDINTTTNTDLLRMRRQTDLQKYTDPSKGSFQKYSCGEDVLSIGSRGDYYIIRTSNPSYYGYVRKADCFSIQNRRSSPIKAYAGTPIYSSPISMQIKGTVSTAGYVDPVGVYQDFVLLHSNNAAELLGWVKKSAVIAGIGVANGFEVIRYTNPACTTSDGLVSGPVYVYEQNDTSFTVSVNMNAAPYFYIKKADTTFYPWSDLPAMIPDPVDTPTPTQPTAPSSSSSSAGTTNVSINRYDFGTQTNGGIKLKVQINGKETEVLLGLNNFTYSYDTPETVYATTSYSLRKGPEGSYGTCGRVRKGQALTIIGRDRDWLIVDLGNGKSGYILEGMTGQKK